MKISGKKAQLALFIILTAAFVSLIYLPVQAQTARTFDITSGFKLWLLNNEARALSSLKSDELLVERVMSPFAFMPLQAAPVAKAEEKLWAIHYRFYVLLDEIQEIYTFAKIYGNGRFAILFKRHRPEIWSVMPLQVAMPGLIGITAIEYRKGFHALLLKALELDAERDIDLSSRLQRAVKKLSDEENRLFGDYLNTFSALYPSDPTARLISAFIQSGSKTQFGRGIKDFLLPVFTAPVFADINISTTLIEPEDPLSELEKLVETSGNSATANARPLPGTENENSDGTQQSQPAAPTTLEPPPPGVEDLFKIWD